MDWKQVAAGGALVLGGVLAGAHVFGAHDASAQAPRQQFRECILARQESVDVGGDGVVALDRDHMIRVPTGWTPIGGGGGFSGNATMSMAFCR